MIRIEANGRVYEGPMPTQMRAMRLSARLASVLGKPALRLLQLGAARWEQVRAVDIGDVPTGGGAAAVAWGASVLPQVVVALGEEGAEVLDGLLSDDTHALACRVLAPFEVDGHPLDGTDAINEAFAERPDPWGFLLAAALVAGEAGLFPWPAGSDETGGSDEKTTPAASPTG